ncbi:MAG: sugar phosphate isomerase/epimerase [Asticcacaulis sp.]
MKDICSRRDVWQGALGLGLTASFATVVRAAEAAFPRIGAQVYTVREAFKADPLGTLRRLKNIGYDEVELTGFGGLAPKVLRQALSDMGLKVPSIHIGLNDWRTRPEAALDEAAELGVRYVVLAWVAEADRHDWKALSDGMNPWGELAKARGLRFAYHNHDFEFTQKVDGEPVLHTILNRTSADLVTLEFDVYWSAFAGYDPLHVLKHHGERIELLHLKDIAADRKIADVGSGTLDFPKILKKAKALGVKHVYVERDDAPDPFASVTQSLAYLRKV